MDYLKYKDVKLPFWFNFGAQEDAERSLKKDIGMMNKVADHKTVLFFALKEGFKEAGDEFTYKIEDMRDILNYAQKEFIALFKKQMKDLAGDEEGGEGEQKEKKLETE